MKIKPKATKAKVKEMAKPEFEIETDYEAGIMTVKYTGDYPELVMCSLRQKVGFAIRDIMELMDPDNYE